MGGNYKGRILSYPRHKKVRPTQGLVRAAVFNILGERVKGARVGDFFCGAGSLGLEALSRGAQSVLFIDKDLEALRFLRKNLNALSLQAQVKRGDVIKIIPRLLDGQFDIVFLDPPYRKGLGQKTVEKLAGSSLVVVEGLIVVEHSAQEPILACPGLSLFKERIYGDTCITILMRA